MRKRAEAGDGAIGGEACHWAEWGELDRRGLGMRAGHRAPGRLCWVASREESTHWVRKLASARQEHVSDVAWVAISARNEKERRKKTENQDCVSTLKTACTRIRACVGYTAFSDRHMYGCGCFFLQTRQSHCGGHISWFTIFTLTCSGSPPPDTHTHRLSRPLSVFGSTGLLRIVVSH